MLTKQTFIALAAVLLLIPVTTTAKDYTHSDIIESFTVSPALTRVSLSPNGERIVIMRSTSKDGDYIVEVRETANLKKDPVLFASDKMEMQSVSWLNDELLLIGFRQNIQDGNRNYWVSKSGIVNADGKGKWRIPFPKDNQASFSVVSTMRQDKEHILLNYDINNNRYPDVIKYNIYTGRTQTVFRGNSKFSSGLRADYDGVIRAASSYDLAENSFDQYARIDKDSEWQLVFKDRAENRENLSFLAFSKEKPEELYVLANRGQDTAGIYIYNLKTEEYSERLFGLESVDAGGVILSSKEADRGTLLGFSYTAKNPSAVWLDEYEEGLRESVKGVFPGKQVFFNSRSEDDNQIVLYTEADKDPGTYYLLSNKKDLQVIGERNPLVDRDLLGSVKYIKYKARDGLKIPSYVTIPVVGKKPYPLVVMPHGGPWVRDEIIYDEWAQLLASHGYMVLQANYRGSTGYGLNHWKLGDNQWGMTMQDDLDDGAKFLIDRGLADPDRVGIFGWSYGGYAAFAASVRENGPFACALAGAGVSDLDRIGASLFNQGRYGRIFQGKTVSGVSALQRAEKITMPLFIVHGSIDQRVPVEQSRIMVDKLKKIGKPHTYMELEGADHFSNTLYYRHKAEFYPAMIDFFDNKCWDKVEVAQN
ncbi:alpha/beta hydrolase family protein [Glaciecola petra]|uniref:Prolyl oligopeptidase family serine peptidase n=1 Tax=Glaciecola petra TaxID=3075602 RepID=A0ABU2ZV85_9ALTE|nr:prolyl oligopeptidase family serine peptidase [Aestuariibacter sp. P117]MDT0596286.1 prolyl oligopeptidase family serine peptidase [Aestuariibacter sp. P117]